MSKHTHTFIHFSADNRLFANRQSMLQVDVQDSYRMQYDYPYICIIAIRVSLIITNRILLPTNFWTYQQYHSLDVLSIRHRVSLQSFPIYRVQSMEYTNVANFASTNAYYKRNWEVVWEWVMITHRHVLHIDRCTIGADLNHRSKHDRCTHCIEPLQWHGLSHCSSFCSYSSAKQNLHTRFVCIS